MKRLLQKRYRKLCPYGEERLNEIVNADHRLVILVVTLLSVGIVFWNALFHLFSTCYVVGCVVLFSYISFCEIAGKREQRVSDTLHEEFITYLAAVKHSFLSGKNVANAVITAAEEFGEEIRLHAAVLYRILSEGMRKEKVREYVLFEPYDRYLKLFLVQAYEASEKGDVMLSEDVSLFSENLEHLRLVVMEELYHERKKRFEYAGYLFVSLMPVVFMPLFKQWGISFSAELFGFYNSIGKLLELVALAVAYVIYCFLCMARAVGYSTESNPVFLFSRLQEWYRKRLLKEQAEYEIRQFQSVLCMERRMTDNTIIELLEDMEIFSRLFRAELRNCINSYAAGPEKALRRLRENGRNLHPAFAELADGFLAVDEVGIRKAFAEVENNRDRLEKMSRLEAEIQLEKRKDGIDLLSKIPMMITLGAYFIIPFFVISLQGVYEVFYILDELQM